MEQENLRKTQKSKIWIIGTIWSIIVTGLIVAGVIWGIVNSFLLNMNQAIVLALNILFTVCILIYSVKLGVGLVVKKSIVLNEDIVKISIGVVATLLFFQIISWLLSYILRWSSWDWLQYVKLGIFDVFLFLANYYWLKRFTIKN